MPSIHNHHFSLAPQARIQRSAFDRSFDYKTTFNAGYLIPFFTDEVLPGDTFNTRFTFFGRLATPIHPIMDNLYLESFYFFVPFRLVWSNFHKFMGAQDNPGDSTSYLVPQVTVPVGGYAVSSIWDYFGLPIGIAGFTHSA